MTSVEALEHRVEQWVELERIWLTKTQQENLLFVERVSREYAEEGLPLPKPRVEPA